MGKRAHRPVSVERDSALYHGFGIEPGEPVEWQHEPPLESRKVLKEFPDGRKLYWPDENDPTHLRPMRPAAHKEATYGAPTAASAVGSDRHTIDRTRRLSEKQEEFRRRMLAKQTGETPPSPAKPKHRWGKRSMRRKQEATRV
jgi:hypothetical protein